MSQAHTHTDWVGRWKRWPFTIQRLCSVTSRRLLWTRMLACCTTIVCGGTVKTQQETHSLTSLLPSSCEESTSFTNSWACQASQRLRNLWLSMSFVLKGKGLLKKGLVKPFECNRKLRFYNRKCSDMWMFEIKYDLINLLSLDLK